MARLHELRDRLPLVLLKRQLAWLGRDDDPGHVCSDPTAGTLDAVRHLDGLGHTRIGLVVRDQPATALEIREGDPWTCIRWRLDIFNRDTGARFTADEHLNAVLAAGATAIRMHGDKNSHRTGGGVSLALALGAWGPDAGVL